jgi:hypothetical protein
MRYRFQGMKGKLQLPGLNRSLAKVTTVAYPHTKQKHPKWKDKADESLPYGEVNFSVPAASGRLVGCKEEIRLLGNAPSKQQEGSKL